MTEKILDDYEEYEEDGYYICYCCGWEGKEVHRQKSDLYPGEEILICIECGGIIDL